MHRPLRSAGFLAALALLSAGCGHKPQPETPQPVNEETTPMVESSTPASVNEDLAPAKNLDQEQRATLEERISFAFDQSDLSSAARQQLSAKVEILRQMADLSLRIEGHADERGSDEYNLALSNRRSAAAMRYLVSQGISQSRLEIVGYGEERPLDSAESESAWAKNRRAHFVVTSK